MFKMNSEQVTFCYLYKFCKLKKNVYNKNKLVILILKAY